MKYTGLLFILLLNCTGAYAWDSAGHRVISKIAYMHLTPAAKNKIDVLTEILDSNYSPVDRFLYVSNLPDQWRKNVNDKTASWHFYNAPWSMDGTSTIAAASPNLFTELENNKKILLSSNAEPQKKALALTYVIHLVEDAHQPLHCVNAFSKAFPLGDFGGNRFKIKNSAAKNLHAYWDQSVHLWMLSPAHYPPTNKKISRIALSLQNEYPENYFGIEAQNADFSHWQQQCYEMGKTVAYATPKNTKLSLVYVAKVKEVAGQQMVLAGYRLARILNKVANFN